MPRKPHDIAHINLRLPETLRGKIERAAKKHRFSLNNEIRLRLEGSFETVDAVRRTLSDILLDMQLHWDRYADRFLMLDLAEELARRVLTPDQDGGPDAVTLAQIWLSKHEQFRGYERGVS
jgi:Arc-like DNA binding domain